jgi:predicted nuclease of restriction endonuclease-like (RecB) superfamily
LVRGDFGKHPSAAAGIGAGRRRGSTSRVVPIVPAERLVEALSFSHFAELVAIEDPLKRVFYEVECLRGGWSVRELKRQIGSLYFERTGLSRNKKKLADMVQAASEKADPQMAVRDPYVFEFLGLKSSETMGESALEDALLDRLQDFLLELGHGFCFEARQRRIIIGETCGFVDLIFYHRVLKCHVLVELKVGKFSHEHLGQLNTYVTWYRRHMMSPGDNRPVGLLLCADKDHALAEYALAGLGNRIFVSKYQTNLPTPADLQRVLGDKIRELKDMSR